MQTGEPNWAAVDGEAEMDYGKLPGILPDLGPKLNLQDDLDRDENIDSSDPAVRSFLQKLPSHGPYKIMITNLPQNVTEQSLESELKSKYKITAKIQFMPGRPYCFLKFDNRLHCIECTTLFGARIHGASVVLKVSPSDQQAEIRRSNTRSSPATRSSGAVSTRGRFSNLSRDGTSSREPKKHKHPVGGSIRKKRPSRNNQSSSQSKPTNPWNSESKASPKSDYKILPRGNRPPPASTGSQSNNRFSRGGGPSSGASSAPPKREDTRSAPKRTDNFRDRRTGRDNFRDRDSGRDSFRDRDSGRDNFRDRDSGRSGGSDFNFGRRGGTGGRKLREDDGRADGAMNWRRGGTTAPPRRNVDRRDPTRDSGTSDFSRRAANNTNRTSVRAGPKDKEKEVERNPRKNPFAALQEDD